MNLKGLKVPVGDAHLVRWGGVEQGLGLGVILEQFGEAGIGDATGAPGLSSVTVPMCPTSHREVRTNRTVRVVFDLLAESCPPTPSEHRTNHVRSRETLKL